MTIQYAILGLLDWQPFTGYELKKLFADSAVFYWSGNNNQIYKTLIQLHEEGFVTQEIQLQESLPARKIYTITEQGRSALKQWALSTPALPEFRNTFLVQFAWADLLHRDELDALLAKYEEEVRLQMLMQRDKAQRKVGVPARTAREAYLWEMIFQNVVSGYENELSWVRSVRAGLKRF